MTRLTKDNASNETISNLKKMQTALIHDQHGSVVKIQQIESLLEGCHVVSKTAPHNRRKSDAEFNRIVENLAIEFPDLVLE
jgi:hypothetical protein